MRLILFIIIACSFVPASLFAQKKITRAYAGLIRDSTGNTPLESATVSAIDLKDSSLLTYTLSDSKGKFELRSLPTDINLMITFSFHGYHTFVRKIILSSKLQDPVTDTITLGKDYAELDEVVVVAEKPPVLFKKDTVEFNASSFKTKPDAVVEDLLKQLPGVDVDKDGNITVNGKPVTKITVDGRDFFSGDLKIASKNLPKDIIDKIQVSDNKSKEAIFNNTTTGNEDKTINITLKKDKKKGWFGRVSAGYGTNGRYEAGGNLNRFKGKNQVNLIGNVNNINRQGSGGGGGGGSGITESGSIGLNFGTETKGKLKLNGSYFYNETSNINNQRRRRENILPDTSFYYISQTDRQSENKGHNFSMHGNIDLDTLTNLNFNVGANLNNGRSLSSNNSYSEDLKFTRINSSINDYLSNSDNLGVSGNMFFGRRFRKKGRGITMNLSMGTDNSDGVNDNIGVNTYNIDGTLVTDSLNQRSNDNNSGRNINISATYSEPISKDLNVIVRIGYSSSLNNNSRITNNLNGNTGKYDIEDSLLSNSFRNKNNSISPGLTFNYRTKKIRATLGNSVSFLKQDNFSFTTDSLMSQRFANFFPAAAFGLQLSQTNSININYNGNTQQPSIQQLQPIRDNANPLYITLGNPDLQPSFTHRVNANFQMQKPQSNAYIFAGVTFFTISNQITQEVYYDSAARQISRPVNTNGNSGGSFYFNYGRTWKKKKFTARINLNPGANINRNTVLNNKVINRATTYGFSQGINIQLQKENVFDLSPRYMIRFNDTRYSIEQSGLVASSITQSLGIDLNVYITKKFTIENSINNNYNNRIAPGFRKSVTSWTASASLKMLKKDRGVLRLLVYDLLNQNTSVYRNITANYIEDVQQDVLQRYFMLSFTYNVTKF
ncbi:MAG: TonB-dependent receptor [Chitinophagaceae bacterium]|nr:MAG: TonB-dependent receptor [Chitinophagaceae bacterium]